MTLSALLTSDLATILDTDDFATAVIFTPDASYPYQSSDTVTINAIFDKTFIETNGVESLKPVLFCKSSDVINATHTNGNSMIENGTTKYKVVGIENDGTGITQLLLEEQ